MGKKPTVFNYRDYELAQDEIRRLRGQLANMEIKNRIAVTDIYLMRFMRWKKK